MSILRFDSNSKGPRKKRIGFRLLMITTIAGLLTIGFTLASRISLNSGGTVEFGQGFLAMTTCDKDGIKVTPINSFYNKPGPAFFTFNAIQIEHISAECAGKDFVIKVYNQNGQQLGITNDGDTVFYEARIFFQPFNDSILISDNDGSPDTVSLSGYWADQFTLVGTAPIVVGTLNNLVQLDPEAEVVGGNLAAQYFELDLSDNSFQITFDPAGELAAGFTDSKNVYHVSLETRNHQG